MPNPTDEFLGLRLTSYEAVHEYVHLTFDDGAAFLSIYNPCEIDGPELSSKRSFLSLVGRRIFCIVTGPDAVELGFGEGWSFKVDLRDDAFSGPEAMVFQGPEKPIVVWN